MKKLLCAPFRKQVLEYSCFAAAVCMALRFYGDDIDKRRLYWATVLPGSKKAQDVKLAQILVRKGYGVTSF